MESRADGERGPQLRGERLRKHVLWAAKEVFLEAGYEGASMDMVAARAQTSKRSVYAHFESKEKLFFAVLEFARELHLERLRTPDAYADDRDEAVVMFCGRVVQLLAWETQARTGRLIIAAAERLPGSTNAYFDAIFGATYERLGAFLADRYGFQAADAVARARTLVDQVALPRFVRTLLMVDAPIADVAEEGIARDVDLGAIRVAATAVLALVG